MAARRLALEIALLGFVVLIGLVRAESQVVCLGPSCPPANLTCPSPLVLVPTSAQQGFKASSSQCAPLGSEQCPQESCCKREPGDCLKPFTPASLKSLADQCWGKTQCQPPTSPDSSGCNFTTHGTASYALHQYSCVNESEILSFRSSEAKAENETAVMHFLVNQTLGDEAWMCYVESSDCKPRPASVFLYVNSSQTQPNCSTLSVHGVNMSCDVYAAIADVILPVRIGVTSTLSHVISSAWAVVRAEDGATVRAWCGLNQSSPEPTDNCSDTTPSGTVSSTSTPGATAAQSREAGLVAATAVGWVIAVLAIIATGVLLVLLLRRQGKFPGFLRIFRKENTAMMPDPATLEAPAQSTSPPAVTSPSSDVTELQATKPSENAYMDMEGNSKTSAKGANSRKPSQPAPVVSEEEYSPLELEAPSQEGEMYSPLEVEGDENEYQAMPQDEEIYENA